MAQTGTRYDAVRYDAVIVGGGHNGLVSACYLAMAGLSVLILEKNETTGGATYSKKVFPGVDARLSVYSYLISLLPRKILTDLGIHLDIRRRAVASYTPVEHGEAVRGLLISNESDQVTRESFIAFTGDDREYRRFRRLDEKLNIFAQKVWPTLLAPMPSKAQLCALFQTPEERAIWDYMVEKPLAALIEDHLEDDTVRGAVFTDAKIGHATYPDDPSLLQNRTFLYHVIGQGTGEWSVPVGGMGALADALKSKALSLGVTILTQAEVVQVDPGTPLSTVHWVQGQAGEQDASKRVTDARYILFNASSDVANRCLPGIFTEDQVDGSVFKINMLLKLLPILKDSAVSPSDAFAGTFHLYEGYEYMKGSFRSAQANGGPLGSGPLSYLPGEMYCHSLTDPSILGMDLQTQGYHTLTLFGLDVPYRWFPGDNDRLRTALIENYLESINQFIEGDIRDCLATDANGDPCIEAKTPLDLERSLSLPKGNIFHGNLSWPFAESEEEAGTWGVETRYPNIFVCGSSARRGGAVSGIPGHNAAKKVLSNFG